MCTLFFSINRVLEPLFNGDYPKVMRQLVGDRLPRFTEKERKMVKGSTDFIGINYYNSHYARHESNRSNISNASADNYDAFAVQEGKLLFAQINFYYTSIVSIPKKTQGYPRSILIITLILVHSLVIVEVNAEGKTLGYKVRK